jgi:hypothetical protein
MIMIFEVATIEEDTAERFVVRFRIHDGMVKFCACLIVPFVVILALLPYTWYYSIIFSSFLVIALVIRNVFWTSVAIDSPGKTIQVESNFPVTLPLRTHATISFDEVAEVLVHNYGQDRRFFDPGTFDINIFFLIQTV